MGSHPTIKDVAKKAGVSITTVSFVLNNRTDVVISEEVKKRVAQVARDMDYHPSALAAGLAGKRTRNLGVVFFQEDRVLSDPFYSHVVEGIVKETLDKNFNLYFSTLKPGSSGYQGLPKIIREKNVDGVFWIGPCDGQVAADIKERRVPLVTVDGDPSLKDIDTIQVENKRGGVLAVEHLVRQGHKQVALLTAGSGRPGLSERGAGWKEALLKNGLPAPQENIFSCDTASFEAACLKAKEALKNKKITAIFCATDEMAAGALKAAREAGRRVPQDLSVVGFGNTPLSLCVDPSLTTVGMPKEEMGRMAVVRMLEIIENKDMGSLRQDVPVELIVRDSSAQP